MEEASWLWVESAAKFGVTRTAGCAGPFSMLRLKERFPDMRRVLADDGERPALSGAEAVDGEVGVK